MSKDSNATDSNSSLEYKFPEKNYNLDERFAEYVKSQEGKYISKEGLTVTTSFPCSPNVSSKYRIAIYSLYYKKCAR